jgi:hypothetical protein
MLTLLFMVIFAAIFIFFSKEMAAFLKKLYGVYWIRVLAPLGVLAWIWVWNDENISLLFLRLKEKIALVNLKLAAVLPQNMQWIAEAAGLFFLASIPTWLLYLRFSRTIMTKTQTDLIMRIYFFSWVFFAIIFLT